jgi:SAM-dependent methyltransferase
VNALHHWTDRAAAVEEITRVLRPGGRAVLLDEDFDDPAHPWHERFAERRAAHDHDFEMVDPESIAAAFRAAGCQRASGSHESVGGRPAKVVRITR